MNMFYFVIAGHYPGNHYAISYRDRGIYFPAISIFVVLRYPHSIAENAVIYQNTTDNATARIRVRDSDETIRYTLSNSNRNISKTSLCVSMDNDSTLLT